MSRLPHNVSTEELLASLESAEDVESTTWTNDVPHFLSHFRFEQGEFKVRVNLLFALYRLYSKAPLKQAQFTNTVSQFIEYNHPYFKINVKPIKIAKVVHSKKLEISVNFLANLAIKKHFERFIKDKNIKVGKYWIESIMLYEVYRHYCIDKKIAIRLDPNRFARLTQLYFRSKRVGSSKGLMFLINLESVQDTLTKETIQQVNSRRKVTSEKTKMKQSAANIAWLKRSEEDDKKSEN